jgi:hypothetical protein
MSETKQSGGGSSLMDHGNNNRQTPGEFAGQGFLINFDKILVNFQPYARRCQACQT